MRSMQHTQKRPPVMGLHIWLTLWGFVRPPPTPTSGPHNGIMLQVNWHHVSGLNESLDADAGRGLASCKAAGALTLPNVTGGNPDPLSRACLIFHQLLSAPKQGGECTQEK
ncbi:hypothetical protein AAFF_G00133240 [Aldrovandia affinis]|uniref:Uncharacterized protein n=1 Tax=Aldrovandia affinis TaxID=143900 RepID=A0AAD7RQA6_9TELE|nr:hypothetical protein AAFF_G00133240 [Aldrovandia affinis]